MDKRSYINHAKAWECIEDHEAARETPFVRHARTLAQQAQLPACSAAVGGLLNTYETLTHASSVIVIGTGSLVETAQLVEGLHGEGKLTAVDSSVQVGAQVRMLLKSMKDDTRTTLRMVSAQPGVYLQRLNGADYDLIVVCGDASNYEPAYEQAPRLLKHGGTIVFTDALAMASPHAKGGLTNPADRSPKAMMMRGLLDRIEDDERFVTALTPAGTGLLIAGYR